MCKDLWYTIKPAKSTGLYKWVGAENQTNILGVFTMWKCFDRFLTWIVLGKDLEGMRKTAIWVIGNTK